MHQHWNRRPASWPLTESQLGPAASGAFRSRNCKTMLTTVHVPEGTSMMAFVPCKFFWLPAWARPIQGLGSQNNEECVRLLVWAEIQGECPKCRAEIASIIHCISDLVMLQVDSVGSSVLFMRPYVFQQGATFGVANLVGADWEREVCYP